MFVNTGEELINICKEKNISIWEYALEAESEESGLSQDVIFEKMKKNFQVMINSSNEALHTEVISVSGLIGGDAHRLYKYSQNGFSLTGEFVTKAMARALSSSEVNAAMGKIVACPTAGSCGILPAAIISAGEKLNKSEDEMIKALFTASTVGVIIAKNASVSGAEGGCQAECGSAAAMASAAIVEMMGGTPEQSLYSSTFCIQNIMGLVCDPVAGLVEVPCALRNASGVTNALISADMAIAGIKSIIPFDETIAAMYKVGRQLPMELRETALGGIADTPTGQRLKEQVLK